MLETGTNGCAGGLPSPLFRADPCTLACLMAQYSTMPTLAKHTSFFNRQPFGIAVKNLLSLLLAACFLACCKNACAVPYKVGFLTLSHADQENGIRLDIAVWYPTESKKSPSLIRGLPVPFRAVRKASPAEGSFPLILLSHPSSGTRFSAYDTAMELAKDGYVAAAVTHPKDNINHMPDALSWKLFADRVSDLSKTADLLLAHETLSSCIDASRIGVLGFDAGATAALIMGGALPSCENWKDYCRETSSDRDFYCNGWAKPRITKDICGKLPLTKSLADTRIKAVCAVQPSFGMLLTEKALKYFHPALLLVRSEEKKADSKTGKKAEGKKEIGRDLVGMEKRFQMPPEEFRISTSAEGALLAPCPEALADELPDLCYSLSVQQRRELHEEFMPALKRFWNNNLKNCALRTIPEPPDLTPPPPPKPEPKKDVKKPGKRKRR